MLKVSMIGTGYVGLVSGTCFSELGHSVTCIDIDPKKIDLLEKGESPIYEPGLSDLLIRNIKSKRLFFSSTYDSVQNADIVFLCVGTPTREDGSADLTYIYSAAKMVAQNIKEDSTVVIKSTVPVGTFKTVREIIQSETNKKFTMVNNPEFLKEGAAISDFMKPDRIVVGTDCEDGSAVMRDLYKPITDKGFPLIEMTNSSAEMTKYAANCFLATKISFINEIATLCEKVGANIDEVKEGVKTDPRVGKYFLNPGCGYGGSCFPKDVKALVHLAKENELDFKIVQAADDVNNYQRYRIVERVFEKLGNNLSGKKIALWGLAFKPETDDIREAPSKFILEKLLDAGANVVGYDPVAGNNFRTYLKEINAQSVEILDSSLDCLNQSDALIIVTEWREFSNPNQHEMKRLMAGNYIFDGRNVLNKNKLEKIGFEYVGIGR